LLELLYLFYTLGGGKMNREISEGSAFLLIGLVVFAFVMLLFVLI